MIVIIVVSLTASWLGRGVKTAGANSDVRTQNGEISDGPGGADRKHFARLAVETSVVRGCATHLPAASAKYVCCLFTLDIVRELSDHLQCTAK